MGQKLQTETLLLPDGARRALAHRGTQSDAAVLRQIFQDQDYALAGLSRGPELMDHYHALENAGRRPLIIDCGANIGASAVYFAAAFPAARIIAIEPHPENFALLTRNTHGLDVDCRLAAIGAEEGRAHVQDNGFGEWGFQTALAADGTCPVLSLAALTESHIAAGFSPFIVKIDIEGAEADLFRAATGWVREFPLLTVEVHDRMHPGRAISRNFLRCIANEDRDFLHRNHNIFSVRNPVAG